VTEPTAPPELAPAAWRRAADALAAKMVADLSFERALHPAPAGGGRYAVAVGPVRYSFAGRPAAMDSWRVEPGSVRRGSHGNSEPAEPYRLLLDLHAAFGLEPAVTALTVAELSATLSADAHLASTGRPAAELADLPYADLEGHLAGHPWIFANNGRVGFSAADRRTYPPEARRRHRLPWIAADRRIATHHGIQGGHPGTDPAALYAAELGEDVTARFTAALRARRGLDPDCYLWLPVHPWQWDEVVVPLFAEQLATDMIVPLGTAPDRYAPQQSIRTFSNVDRPDRLDVKLPLSILNTMVYRGIPTELVRAAPASTRWVHELAAADAFLRDECRVVLPGEVAAVAVRHPVFEAMPDAPYRYRQLLGAIWREPLAAALEQGQRARSLAALLHVDPDGRALVAELVARSGLAPAQWLARLFGVVLPPLLHLLYRHGIAFNPHGENASVIYDAGDVPVRLAVKDFVDDMKLLATDLPSYAGLPAEALAVLMRAGAEQLCGSVFKSLLVCHFRYLAPLAAEQLGVPEPEFWRLVRAELSAYQRRFGELADRFALFDLTAPSFERVCLNRERLLPGGYHDRADRDPPGLGHLDVPPVPNPLAKATGE
jgi:siderophore synthetase component